MDGTGSDDFGTSRHFDVDAYEAAEDRAAALEAAEMIERTFTGLRRMAIDGIEAATSSVVRGLVDAWPIIALRGVARDAETLSKLFAPGSANHDLATHAMEYAERALAAIDAGDRMAPHLDDIRAMWRTIAILLPSPSALTLRQKRVLDAVKGSGPITREDLALDVGMKVRTLTNDLGTLKKLGLVQHVPACGYFAMGQETGQEALEDVGQRVLAEIRDGTPRTVDAIAEVLGASVPDVELEIRRLEKVGHVKRTMDGIIHPTVV